jgi:hypothetical protein
LGQPLLEFIADPERVRVHANNAANAREDAMDTDDDKDGNGGNDGKDMDADNAPMDGDVRMDTVVFDMNVDLDS